MKSAPDENDRLMDGTLPLDPFDGTVPSEASDEARTSTPESPAPLPWRTLHEVEANAKANPREWEWEGFLAIRTVAVISGEPKGGKSEVLAAFLAAKTRGSDWLGPTMTKGRVVLVTEEGDHDLVDKLRRYGADFDAITVLSRDAVGAPPTWAQLIPAAVAKAKEVGASILVIDTFSFWAAIEGEGERVEGTVREALLALQLARNEGLATALVHHNVKSKDIEGIAALRGSGAFAASVESVGIFRRYSQDPEDCRRKIEVFSRIAPCTLTTIERVIPADGGEPHYRRVESLATKAAGSAGADEKITKGLAKVGGWVDRKALPELTGLSDRTLDTRLPVLVEGHRIERMGRGVQGDPFRYASKGTPGPHLDDAVVPTSTGKRRKAETPQISAGPQISASFPLRGGGAGADSPRSAAPLPPTGGRCGAVIERGSLSEGRTTSVECGEATEIATMPSIPGEGPDPLPATDAETAFPPSDCAPWLPQAVPAGTCPSCGSTDLWRGVGGSRVCRVCHPPAQGAEVGP